MNCKHCNAEMDENAKICPECGKPVNEPEWEAVPAEETTVQENMNGPEIVEKKNNTGKIALAVVAVVVILAVLVAVIVSGMGGNNAENAESTEGTGEVAATIPADGKPDDVTCKGTYTVSDDEALAAADTVVATMNGKELTVSDLQVYYWMEVVYFLQDYSSYASAFGLDYTQPLDAQACMISETEMTWQQYFLACALDSWISYQSMSLEAEANGLEMDAELRVELDHMEQNLDEAALEYDMADAQELIRANFGAGATVESYVKFWEQYYTGYTYYNYAMERMEIPAEDVEAYFAENEETYAESGITKDTKYANARHILLMVEGGTTDDEGNTTYSDDEWEACRAEAQAILDEWLAGDATEESFAELANTYSEDPGSNTDGGLYEDIYEGEMVPNFNDWCFDESRVSGDYGLVQTEYGYHIMYFVSLEDDIWYTTAENDLRNEKSGNLTLDAVEKYPAEIDYSSIVLGNISLVSE